MGEPYILALEDATEVALVGGKAVNLGALLRAEFLVPGGFVVTTAAFRDAGAHRAEIEEAVKKAYREIGKDGVAVAVRSSATAEDMAGASMAGQYETYLDIVGEEAVVEAVKKCWGSLLSPRTRAYLQQHGIAVDSVAMAVVVQRLIPAEIAGVMFTANPHSGREDEVLIEASWGLGEAVVSGMVQPDTMVLDRESGRVKSCVIGTKEVAIEAGTHEPRATAEGRRGVRCVSDEQVAELHALARRVAEHFKSPQDTEWGIAGGKLYLLQSRAVTTLGAAKVREEVLEEARTELRAAKGEGGGGRGDWARHNLGETVPHPTPLTWSVLKRFMTPAGGFGKMYAMAGYEPSAALNPEGFLTLIGGRIYMDLSLAPEMFFAGFPFRYDTDLLRATPSASQAAPTIPAGSLLALLKAGRRLKKSAKTLERLAENFEQELDGKIVPEFHRWIAEEAKRDLAGLSGKEWVRVWKEREGRVMDDFGAKSLLPSLICGLALENLRGFLAPQVWKGGGGEEDPEELANLLAAGGPADATLRSNDALYRVAAGALPLETWLHENGHRAPEEFDLAAARWRERPEAVRTLAQHLLGGARPGDEHHARREEADRRVEELKSGMTRAEQVELDRHVSLARRYLRFREDGKHELMRGYELLRQMVVDAGRRLGLAAQDICLLNFEELAAAIEGAKAPDAALIARRKQRRAAEARLALPDVIGAQEIATLGELKLPAHGDRIAAFPISSGACVGPVRIVASPDSAGDLGRDYVLVCRSTDPSWTPLFVNAAGIVLECGGSLSHGAVVAREMGKPAVVLPNATQILRENQRIAVDGNQGAVLLNNADGEAAAAVVDANDSRIAFSRIPPAPGRREKAAARLRNYSFALWAVFLILVFFVPQTHLRELSTAVLDKLLWPVVRSMGAGATVALIAAAFAVLSMVGQWLLTDTPRLRVAKRRATGLRKEAMALPRDSVRRKALLGYAGAVQTRVTLAAFVPLAVLLGPMVMSFLWLPERIDPAVQNPRPGATAVVSAVVDGEYSGPLTLRAPALKVDAETKDAASIRPPLADLAKELKAGKIPERLQSQVAGSGKTADALLADLEQFLAYPLPPQIVTWNVETEDQARRWPISVASGDGPPVEAELVMGNSAPPPTDFETDAKGNRYREILAAKPGPVQGLRIRFTDSRREEMRAFFAPFAGLGWHYDFGWLGIYLLVYIAVLFPVRWVLRVP